MNKFCSDALNYTIHTTYVTITIRVTVMLQIVGDDTKVATIRTKFVPSDITHIRERNTSQSLAAFRLSLWNKHARPIEENMTVDY